MFYLVLYSTTELNKNDYSNEIESPSLCNALMQESDFMINLMEIIWFLFEILFCGNILFEFIMLMSALISYSSKEYLTALVRYTFMLASITLPGYILSIVKIGEGSKYIKMKRFFIVTLL